MAAAPAGAAPGDPLGPAFEVAPYGNRDVVAARSANGAFVVLYQNPDFALDPLMAQIYNANGSAQGAPVTVATPASDAYITDYAVAMDGAGNFVVAWNEFNGKQSIVKGRRFDANGVPQGGSFLPDGSSTREALSPAVATNAAGQFVITWLRSEKLLLGGLSLPPLLGCLADNNLEFPDASIAYRRYQADGTASGVAARIAAAEAGAEVNVVVCFLDEASVGLERNLIDGNGTMDAPAVAVGAGGDFSFAWSVTAGAGVANDSLGLGVANSSIALQRYSASGIPALQQKAQALHTSRVGDANYSGTVLAAPAIATGPAGTTVVWNTEQFAPGQAHQLQVLTRAYAPDGMARVSAPVSVAGGTQVWSYSDYVSSIAATPTGSVLAWRSTSSAGNALPQRIQAQLLDASGKASGVAIDVADSADGNVLAFVGAPKVVSDSSGDFAVFWTTSNLDETDSRTYGRLYSGH